MIKKIFSNNDYGLIETTIIGFGMIILGLIFK